jgi:hypothetical protein
MHPLQSKGLFRKFFLIMIQPVNVHPFNSVLDSPTHNIFWLKNQSDTLLKILLFAIMFRTIYILVFSFYLFRVAN